MLSYIDIEAFASTFYDYNPLPNATPPVETPISSQEREARIAAKLRQLDAMMPVPRPYKVAHGHHAHKRPTTSGQSYYA